MSEKPNGAPNPRCERCQESLEVREFESCEECRELAALAAELRELASSCAAASPSLLDQTLAAMAPELRQRRQAPRQIGLRLALAGIAALPLIVLVHGVGAWFGHELLLRLLGPTVATTFLYLIAATMLLGLAVGYGSLPLLANWVCEARSRLAYRDYAAAIASPDWSLI